MSESKSFSRLPSTELQTSIELELSLIAEFWNRLRVCDEVDSTTWKVLEPLERRITDCLFESPPDLKSARRLTAQAMSIIASKNAF